MKRAAGGTPNLATTLCAFGNMPGGGLIILGLDENSGFTPTGLSNVASLEAGIASQARNRVAPPVQVHLEEVEVDGSPVLLATVDELPNSGKPARVGGRAYLRQADGDYPMSDQEVSQLLARRERPRFDRATVVGSGLADLDDDLRPALVPAARSSSRRLAAQTEEEVLRNKAVLAPVGPELTLAGLYALGDYPTKFVPSLSLTAAVLGGGQRARDLVHLDGPLPDLLDQAMEWVRRNTRTAIRFGPDGHGRDETEIPMVAVRELIANALVHRDLSPHTQGKRVEIRLKDDSLVISNPGGLWGITREQLGEHGGKSAVNEYLYEICKLTRTSAGTRIIEGEGGGIREVRSALKAVGMAQPRFIDTSVMFTVIVPRHGLLPPDDLAWVSDIADGLGLSDQQRSILVSMRHGQVWTNQLVRKEFHPIDSTQASAALQGLVTAGLAIAEGERNETRYLIRADLRAIDDQPPAPRVRVRTDEVPFVATPVRESTRNGPAVLGALSAGPLTKAEIALRADLTEAQVGYALSKLMDAGLVTRHGGWGLRGTRYERG